MCLGEVMKFLNCFFLRFDWRVCSFLWLRILTRMHFRSDYCRKVRKRNTVRQFPDRQKVAYQIKLSCIRRRHLFYKQHLARSYCSSISNCHLTKMEKPCVKNRKGADKYTLNLKSIDLQLIFQSINGDAQMRNCVVTLFNKKRKFSLNKLNQRLNWAHFFMLCA
jgi:hypothetical protein